MTCSLCNKFNNLQSLLTILVLEFFAITETWLTDNIFYFEIEDRNTQGGEVLIADITPFLLG